MTITRLRAWLHTRTPVLRRMYPIALPFVFIALVVWSIVSPRTALMLSIMALTVVAIIVWASWGRDDDEPNAETLAERGGSPRSGRCSARRRPLLARLWLLALLIAGGGVAWVISPRFEAQELRALDSSVRETLERNPGLTQGRDARSARLPVPAGDYSVEGLRVTAAADGVVDVECTALADVRGRDIATRGYTYYRARVADGRMTWETRQMDATGQGVAHERIKLDIDTNGMLVFLVECPIPDMSSRQVFTAVQQADVAAAASRDDRVD